MTSTAISTARAALYRALTVEFHDVQVVYGPPVNYEEARIVALLGLAQPTVEEAAAIGNQRRTERFRFTVAVKVHDPALSAEEIDTQVFELADRTRDVVGSDTTLGGSVEFAEVVQQESPGPLPAEGGGWFEVVTLQVACRARVTARRT